MAASTLYLIRFFRIVPPNPPLMHAALLVAAAAGGLALGFDASRARAVMLPVLLLQLFAASSGLLVPARRGHYDLLLATGHSRLAIAAVHWAASVLPGVVCWLALAACELAAGGGTVRALLTPGTMVAVALVSTMPWAITAALPRFTGAIGWLLALAMFAVVVPPRDGAWLFETGSSLWWLGAAIAVALYPVLLVGEELAGPHGWSAAGAGVLAVVSMSVTLTWIHGRDIPLEAAQ